MELGNTLFFDELYRQIINIHGALTWIGAECNDVLSLWHQLRALYESDDNRMILGPIPDGNDLSSVLDELPGIVVALACLNTESLEETRDCLKFIQPHLTVGSIVVFNKLNRPDCPGPTLALKEVWGLNMFAIQKSFYSPSYSYIVIT